MKPESWVKAVKAFRRGLSLRESAMVGGVTVEELGERMVELEGARAEVKGELLQKLIEMGMGGDRRAAQLAIGFLGGVVVEREVGEVPRGYREIPVEVVRQQVKALAAASGIEIVEAEIVEAEVVEAEVVEAEVGGGRGCGGKGA